MLLASCLPIFMYPSRHALFHPGFLWASESDDSQPLNQNQQNQNRQNKTEIVFPKRRNFQSFPLINFGEIVVKAHPHLDTQNRRNTSEPSGKSRLETR